MSTKFIKDIGDSAAVLGVILLGMHEHEGEDQMVVTPLTLDHERQVELINLEINKSRGCFIVLARDAVTHETIQITLPFGRKARARAEIIENPPTPTEDA